MIIAPHRQPTVATQVSPSFEVLHSDPMKIYGQPSAPASAEKVDRVQFSDPTEIPTFERGKGDVSFVEALQNVKDLLKEGASKIDFGLPSFPEQVQNNNYRDGDSDYSSVVPAQNSGATLDYLNADLAKHYGMDAKAAYGEALQNTAYQRAVADLKAAGLNPVLAAGSLSPSGSFVAGDTLSRGSGSGRSGGSGSGTSGKYAMSSNLYNAAGVAASIAGAVIGFKFGVGPFKFMNAATVSQLAKNLVQGAIQGFGSLKQEFNK